MAQQVSFNINLKVNGQDSVREVSVNMEELRHAIDEVKTSAEKATSTFIRFNQKLEAIRNIRDIVKDSAELLTGLTDEARGFSEADGRRPIPWLGKAGSVCGVRSNLVVAIEG